MKTLLKAVLWIIVILVVIVAFFLGPVARPIATAAGSKALKVDLAIGRLSVYPFAGNAAVKNLTITDPAFTVKPVVEIGKASVDARVKPLLGKAIEVAHVTVDDAGVVVRRNAAGQFYVIPVEPKAPPDPGTKKDTGVFEELNPVKWIEKILRKGQPPAEPAEPGAEPKAPPFTFIAEDVRLRGATIEFRDDRNAFEPIRITPVDVTVGYLSADPGNSPEPLTFDVNGCFFGNHNSYIKASGSVDKRNRQENVNVHIDIKNIDFAMLSKLASDVTLLKPFQMLSGIGSINGDIILNNGRFGSSTLSLTMHAIGRGARNEAEYNANVNRVGSGGVTVKIPVDDTFPYFHVEQAVASGALKGVQQILGEGADPAKGIQKAAEGVLESVKGLLGK
ncbi:hypothetical protein GX586_09610 [bacterium]|nr:hypothetical protein [bacterium]